MKHPGVGIRVACLAACGAVVVCAAGVFHLLNREQGEVPVSVDGERVPAALAPVRSPAPSGPVEGTIVLRDVTGKSGISFKHTDGSSGEQYIVETITAGVALFDYNQDGYVDVYFLNGAALAGTQVDEPPKNALYLNRGGWDFTDATDEAGLGDVGYGLGVAVADYDNDGDPDVYLNNYGPNVLYRNEGNGTFTDVTGQAGVGNGDMVGAGACFLDMDADGDLDLYVANYVDFTYENHVPRRMNGLPWYVGPVDYRPVPDTLYRNNGDGTFADVSTESGVGRLAGTGMGMVSADFDNDGDTDVFVANDVAANFFWRNDGKGNFEEVGLFAGLAYNRSGAPTASMGVDCGDFDNDGWLDLFLTTYEGQWPVLYKNRGDGSFDDVTVVAGAGTGTFPYVNWGNGLVDFDNDGDRDLFIACGHLQDHVDAVSDTTAYEVPNILLMNTGDGKFADVSDSAGDGMLVKLSSRGTGFDDLDNDGDIDAVVLNSRREPTILRNDTDNDNHWLEVSLRAVRSNRDGVGAHVKVVAGDLTQVAEVHSGRSYQSHYGTRLHFGLGRRGRVDRIEVVWVGGGHDVVEQVRADQMITITEGP